MSFPVASCQNVNTLTGNEVASDIVETPEEVAAVIAEAARHVASERIIACTNCGMAPMTRSLAAAKLGALTAGAALVRRRLAG